MKTRIMLFAAASISWGIASIDVHAGEPLVGTGFTYQGQLKDSGLPVNGQVDLEFRLFNDADSGVQIGATYFHNTVEVVNGLFTAEPDFGAGAFNGLSRWLEVSVANPAGSGNFSTLSPRQAISATPYAVRATRANSAFALDASDGFPTNAVFVNNAGNVGVGMTQPLAGLDIQRNWDTEHGALTLRADRPTLRFSGDATSGNQSWLLHLGSVGPGNLQFYRRANPSGWLPMMTLTPAGPVGIGTASPQGHLHVNGEANTLALEGTTHTYMGFFPRGVGAGRKAWFGFGAAGTNELALVNETGGGITLAPGNGGLYITNGMLNIGDWHDVQWADYGRLGLDTSTRKHKENIKPFVDDFERLLDSQAVTYTRPGRPDRWEIGYIAEDMNDLGLAKLVQFDTNGEVSGFNYKKTVIYLVEIAKAQRDRIAEQNTQLAETQKALGALSKRLEALEQATQAP